jgi:GTP-binding protein HflX
MEEVNKVLAEIGADDIPQIVVLNKIDLAGLTSGVERDEYGRITRIRLSAKTGDGIDLVRQALAEYSKQCAGSQVLPAELDTHNP